MFAAGEVEEAHEYAIDGARRVSEALGLFGDGAAVSARVAMERTSWGQYYDALDTLQRRIASGDDRAEALQERAAAIIDACRTKDPDATRAEETRGSP